MNTSFIIFKTIQHIKSWYRICLWTGYATHNTDWVNILKHWIGTYWINSLCSLFFLPIMFWTLYSCWITHPYWTALCTDNQIWMWFKGTKIYFCKIQNTHCREMKTLVIKLLKPEYSMITKSTQRMLMPWLLSGIRSSVAMILAKQDGHVLVYHKAIF